MRPPGKAFKRRNQSRLLAANKCPCALHQVDIEVEPAPQNIGAQQSISPRLLDRLGQPPHGQRILRAHINNSFGSAHHVSANNHSFQQ